MRKLLYIPIIHDQSDMGSLGSVLEKASSSYLGERRWARHKETVATFWRAIEGFLSSVDAKALNIYQDGLAAEGELGRRVVEEAARRGSKNHLVLLDLIARGAELRNSEDIRLLLEEGQHLLEATQEGPETTEVFDKIEYQRRKEQLTEQRDRFIADRINQTLREGETGVLFMGADHDVLRHLPEDIIIISVKEREKVRAYFQELLTGHDEETLEHLARYVASPV